LKILRLPPPPTPISWRTKGDWSRTDDRKVASRLDVTAKGFYLIDPTCVTMQDGGEQASATASAPSRGQTSIRTCIAQLHNKPARIFKQRNAPFKRRKYPNRSSQSSYRRSNVQDSTSHSDLDHYISMPSSSDSISALRQNTLP